MNWIAQTVGVAGDGRGVFVEMEVVVSDGGTLVEVAVDVLEARAVLEGGMVFDGAVVLEGIGVLVCVRVGLDVNVGVEVDVDVGVAVRVGVPVGGVPVGLGVGVPPPVIPRTT